MTPSLAFGASVCPSACLSFPTLLACSSAVIQAFQLLSRWKNAGSGASPPGRQLGSPSLTLKTRYPPERILLAYRPDPLSEPPRAASPPTTPKCPPCFIGVAPRCPSRRFRTHVQIYKEPAGNNRFLMSGQAARPLGSLSPKGTAGRDGQDALLTPFFLYPKYASQQSRAASRGKNR